jgi:hypothetical protein
MVKAGFRCTSNPSYFKGISEMMEVQVGPSQKYDTLSEKLLIQKWEGVAQVQKCLASSRP